MIYKPKDRLCVTPVINLCCCIAYSDSCAYIETQSILRTW